MEEIQNIYLGALPERVDIRDYKLTYPITATEFPAEFEIKPCAVKNQGSVGSCVAHAIAETIEYHNKVQDNITKKMSVGFIYGNRRNSLNKGSGMYVREALANARNYGDVYLTDFNENKETPEIINLFEERYESLKDKAYPFRFSTYFRVKSDNDIKYALMNYGPVIFSMKWYSDIKVGADGVITTTQDKNKIRGGHCMIIYGWNEKGWKIQNSWGTTWGLNGKAILPYNITKSECWGITDEIHVDDDVVKPFNSKLLELLVKVVNFILNLFKKK